MKIIVNPQSHGGRGGQAWRRLEPRLAGRYAFEAVLPESEEAARQAVLDAAAAGNTVVAAGGDGAVNLALNALMDPATDAPRHDVALGAIGLGSSNDFHKPRNPARDVDGLPVAIDADAAQPLDVGRADWTAPDGTTGTAYFLLNGSMGATAKGNLRYNQPDGLLAFFKGLNTDLAIQWGTLEAITRFENVPARIWVDGVEVGHIAVSNLGVIKRQHFCGGMRYDTPVTPDDGMFDVNLCAGMGKFEFIQAVVAISSGRFLGLPKTHHWRAREVRIRPDAPTALELDGEVREVSDVTLRVVPRAIRVCL